MATNCDNKWVQYFKDISNGLMPYLQLYAQRSMRGSGLGNLKGFHRRFQVPIPSSYSSQSGQGLKGVTMVTPTQQTVEQAKAMKKQDDYIDKQLLAKPPTKRKAPGAKNQKRGKAARGKTSAKAAPKRKKAPSQRQTPRDVFSNTK